VLLSIATGIPQGTCDYIIRGSSKNCEHSFRKKINLLRIRSLNLRKPDCLLLLVWPIAIISRI